MTCGDPPLQPADGIVAIIAASVAVLVYNRKLSIGDSIVPTAAAAVLHVASVVGVLRGRGTAHTYARVGVAVCAAGVLNCDLLHRLGVPWKQSNWVRGAAALHVAVLVAAAVRLNPCGAAKWEHYAAEFSVLPLTVSLAFGAAGAWHTKATGVWCSAEAVAITAALLRTDIAEKASHLTWWMLGSLSVYDCATAADAVCGSVIADYIHPFLLVLSTVVVVGVLVMSVADCSLLRNALTDSGAAVYIVGNFAMHYYPVLRALAGIKPTTSTGDKADGDPLVPKFKVAAVVTIYAMAYDPIDEYGCPDLLDSAWAPLLLCTISIAVALVHFTAR